MKWYFPLMRILLTDFIVYWRDRSIQLYIKWKNFIQSLKICTNQKSKKWLHKVFANVTLTSFPFELMKRTDFTEETVFMRRGELYLIFKQHIPFLYSYFRRNLTYEKETKMTGCSNCSHYKGLQVKLKCKKDIC